MRLIDADELWMEVIHTMDYCDDILEIIEHQKTIEPTHLNDSNTLETLDCIGRQQAIDALKTVAGVGNRALDKLRQLPSAQLEQRWIQCSERLPNSQTEVIVSCRDDSADTIYRYTASGWITTNGEYWIVDNEINPYVVAWMPLPEPWRGEVNDKNGSDQVN